MRVRILGKNYKVVFCPKLLARGECDGPHQPAKKIKISSRLTGLEKLEVLIHEALHAADWTKDEEWIVEAGKDISSLLWRLGYRETMED